MGSGHFALILFGFSLVLLSIVPILQPTFAHQDGCHSWHSCPSDSGSYTCGDKGYCSECSDNNYCKAGEPIPTFGANVEIILGSSTPGCEVVNTCFSPSIVSVDVGGNYVQTGATVTITQQIGGPFDVEVSFGRYDLRYHDLPDPAGPRGTERLTRGGFGVRYRLGETIRPWPPSACATSQSGSP